MNVKNDLIITLKRIYLDENNEHILELLNKLTTEIYNHFLFFDLIENRIYGKAFYELYISKHSMTPRELAEKLNIHEDTLRNYRKKFDEAFIKILKREGYQFCYETNRIIKISKAK